MRSRVLVLLCILGVSGCPKPTDVQTGLTPQHVRFRGATFTPFPVEPGRGMLSLPITIHNPTTTPFEVMLIESSVENPTVKCGDTVTFGRTIQPKATVAVKIEFSCAKADIQPQFKAIHTLTIRTAEGEPFQLRFEREGMAL